MDMVRKGEVRPRIKATYPLRDIARAQEDFQAKADAGKLVLLPQETAT
jgi:alcohol dehydrogenase